jgi:hypothetical protein
MAAKVKTGTIAIGTIMTSATQADLKIHPVVILATKRKSELMKY